MRHPGGWRRLLLGLPLVAAGCGDDEQGEIADPELLQMGADQVIVGMDTHLSREGLRRIHLTADTAYFFTDASEIRLRQLVVTFFDDEGRTVSELTARDGLYHTNSDDVEATGNIVVVDRQENQRLETESLRYRAVEDRLSTDMDFEFQRGDNRTVRGRGFTSTPALDTVLIEQMSGVTRGFRPPGRETGSERPDSVAPPVPEDPTTSDTAGAVPTDTAATAESDTARTEPDSVPRAAADTESGRRRL